MWYRVTHHLTPDQITFAFWLRVLQPINTLVMIWLGIPFVFGGQRDASLGYLLLIGIILGFLVYMLNQVIGPLCMIYQWPPILAALMPIGLMLAFGLYLLHRSRLR